VRELAAGRIDRSDALLQTVLIGEAPATAAARLAAEYGTVTAEQLLDTPFVVLARDPMHTAELLAERQERFGFDSFMTHEPTWTHSASSSRFIAAESEPREDAHFVGVNT
jgi:hypothetical protein